MTSASTLSTNGSRAGVSAPDLDDNLRAEAVERLHGSGYLLLRGVQCEVSDGVLVLSGRVHSFHLKQVTQAVVMKIKGFRAVKNLVQVQPRQDQ
jgi:hypothetical protein